MLTDADVKAYDAAATIIANELARSTALTAASARSAAHKLLTRFAADGISLHGIKEVVSS